jgi:hypothetical protein
MARSFATELWRPGTPKEPPPAFGPDAKGSAFGRRSGRRVGVGWALGRGVGWALGRGVGWALGRGVGSWSWVVEGVGRCSPATARSFAPRIPRRPTGPANCPPVEFRRGRRWSVVGVGWALGGGVGWCSSAAAVSFGLELSGLPGRVPHRPRPTFGLDRRVSFLGAGWALGRGHVTLALGALALGQRYRGASPLRPLSVPSSPLLPPPGPCPFPTRRRRGRENFLALGDGKLALGGFERWRWAVGALGGRWVTASWRWVVGA